MLTSRDRLLAALFALQLAAAAIFGAVLVHGLDKVANGKPTTTIVQGGGPNVGGSLATTGANPSTGAAQGGSGGTTTTTTTTTGGTSSGGAANQAIAAGAPIRIGAIVTETGPINFAASAQGTKAYFDRVNSQGGVNGHKILLQIADDQLDQARGQSAARQMVADGVFAFAAFNAPATENGIVPFLEQNKIPLIGSFGEYAEYHSAYAYAFSAAYGHFGFEQGRYLMSLGVKKPGVIFITNGEQRADDGLTKAYRDGIAAGGGHLATADTFIVQPTQPTFDDVVTQLRLDGVDGIVTILDQTAYNRLQQSLDRQSYHPTHVAAPTFPDVSVTKTAGSEGTYVATDVDFLDNAAPAVTDYVQTVRAEFGGDAQVNYLGEVGWLDAKILVEALRAMGPVITRPRLLAAVNALPTNGFGFTSPLHFNAGAHDPNRCVKFGRFSNGRVVQTKDWSCNTEPF